MAQKIPPEKYSILFYDGDCVPRLFQIGKSKFRFFVFGPPTITFACIAIILFGVIYLNQIKISLAKQEPLLIKELKDAQLSQQVVIEDLKKTNQELTEKLLAKQVDGQHSEFSLFKSVIGQKDLTARPLASIEQMEINNVSKAGVKISFNIVNNAAPDNKLAGFVFVVAKTRNGLLFYPSNSFASEDSQLLFTRGESFSTFRFRPVEATFEIPEEQSEVFIKVHIFSRTGDLILNQSYNLNRK